jgi:N-methylhydantoinase B
MSIDPITLSVIQSGLQQVCDEMDLSFSRAAFSPVIAEANDRSDGIYSAEDGSLIAQGSQGLPVFVGTMQYSTRVLIEMIAQGEVAAPVEGDIYIVNDPYLGGTHLMDVRFAMPFYRNGEIFCWLSNTGHWPDTGGAVPGGFSASATSVEQEGLRLPPVRLFKQGELDKEIYSIICSNIRVADQRIGDVKAQAAALLVGAERLTRILDRYGDDVVKQSIAELRQRASDQMRANVRLIPDGTYRSKAFVDSDGVVNEPLVISLAITADDGELTFDFSGSSEPCRGPMNSVLATTLSSVYLAMRHIFPEVPISAGAFEPLMVLRPEGTFLDAQYPRPVSGCAAEVSQRIAEAVFAALVEALPDRVTAAPAGSSGNFALGGYDPASGRGFVMYQISGRRLWRQFRSRRADQRLFHDRHFQGASGGNHGAAVSRSLSSLCLARGVRRAGQTSRRFRAGLRDRALAGTRHSQLCHGSRPVRAAGRSGWTGRQTEFRYRLAGWESHGPGAPVQGSGHPIAAW